MEKEIINLIFDCDGTLIDSYGAITDTVYKLFRMHNICFCRDHIRECCLRSTVSDTIIKLSEEKGLDSAQLLEEYAGLDEDRTMITLCAHAEDVLFNSAFRCFVYTHRGPSCRDIFESLGILDCFVEIVDKSYHFKRKPDGEGVEYIVDKYGLDRERTFYVGDRNLDIECGVNAGVRTIFLKSSGLDIDCSKADYVVSDLSEINSIFS